MKKKLLLLSAITTLSLALYGCGAEKKDTTTEKDILENAIENVELPETTESADISEKTEDAERGIVDNDVFTNDVFKISFPLKDEWYVCSDAEVSQIIGFTADSVDETGLMTAEQYEAATSGVIYDLVFYFSDFQSNVNITYSNLSSLGMYATLPVENYAEISMTQLESITTPKYTFDELATETYGGSEYVVLTAETDQGYNQKMLLKKENGYMICITLTYFPELESEAQSFLDSFTVVQ